MIIKYSDTNENRIYWQHRRGEEWRTAELDELIGAYERATESGDLISRQAAIDALKKAYWNEDLQAAKDDPCVIDAMTDWAIRQIKALPPAEKTGKWIPVSERLPDEEKGTYWVCTDTEYQCECRWTNVNHFCTELTTNWHWHIMDIPQYTKVIAWMPLPEPYNRKARMVEE